MKSTDRTALWEEETMNKKLLGITRVAAGAAFAILWSMQAIAAGHTVELDPAHCGTAEENVGGLTSSFTGQKEEELNKKVTEILESILTERGYTVFLTSEGQSGEERSAKAIEDQAELLLSIHVSHEDGEEEGIHAFYSGEENSLHEESEKLAAAVADLTATRTGRKNLGVSTRNDFPELNNGTIPSAAVELGSYQSMSDSQYLFLGPHQAELAFGIADGIDTYFSSVPEKEVVAEQAAQTKKSKKKKKKKAQAAVEETQSADAAGAAEGTEAVEEVKATEETEAVAETEAVEETEAAEGTQTFAETGALEEAEAAEGTQTSAGTEAVEEVKADGETLPAGENQSIGEAVEEVEALEGAEDGSAEAEWFGPRIMETSDDTLDQMFEEVSSEAEEQGSATTPSEGADQTAEEMSEDVTDQTVEEMPEDVADQIVEEMPEEVSDLTDEEKTADEADQASEEMQTESDAEVTEEAETEKSLTDQTAENKEETDAAEETQTENPEESMEEQGTLSAPESAGQSEESLFSEVGRETIKARFNEICVSAYETLSTGNGSWALYVRDEADDIGGNINSHKMQAASLIKLFIMGAVYENYDSLCANYGEDAVYGYLYPMITESNNDAANSLVEMLGGGDSFVGMQVVTNYCTAHGYNDTSMGRLLLQSNEFGDNYTSVLDCGLFLDQIYKSVYQTGQESGAGVDWKNTSGTETLKHAQEMFDLLKNQQRRNKIPAALPADVKVANKTGELATVENDAGIIYDTYNGHDLILVFMSENVGSTGEAQNTIAQVSLKIYNYYH